MSDVTQALGVDAAALNFLDGGGQMGAAIRAHDWAATPLGPPSGWPQPLRTAVGLMLGAKQPIRIGWGPELITLINDGYGQILGDRCRDALGRPFAHLWSEVWDEYRPIVEATLRGEAQHFIDRPVTMSERAGNPIGYFTFSYTPIRLADGSIGGIYCAATETTETVLADQRRTAESGRQRAMFENAPSFICTLAGPDHVFEFVNASHRRLFGSAEWIGKPVREAFPDIAGQGFYELLDQVYASGEQVTIASAPARFRITPDGPEEDRLLDFTYAPVRNDAGQVTGIFCEGYDVTARKAVEHAVRDSEAYTRLLLDSTSECFYAVDCTGVTTLCNEAFVRSLGFASKDEVIGRKLHGLIHHSHPDGSEYPVGECPIYQAASSGKSAFVTDESFYRLDGTAFPVEYRAEPIVREGVLQGAICTFSDITDRIAAQAALAEQARTLETLNRTGVALAGELDLERLVQRVTDAGLDLTGAQFGAFFYNVLNAEGESYMLYTLSGADRSSFEGFGMPRATAIFQPTFQGDGILRSDDIMADARYGLSGPHNGIPKGHLPVRSYLAVPVTSRSGEVVGGLFYGHERPAMFTERHEQLIAGIAGQAAVGIDNARLLQTTQQLAETLEARVAERTIELENAQQALRQSQKMEAVGQLTGGIAHDFNNMLAVVIGSLDLLGRRLDDQDARSRRYLDAAADGARRAALLTQRLLAFSRQQPLRPETLEINRLVIGMSELIRRSLGSDVILETVLTAGPWRVSADPNQLENVILNLAVNARDAMPEGGRLTIETQNTHLDARYVADHPGIAAGQYAMIAVSDTGAGMSDEVIAKAFDPFFTTKEVGKGTGLGLSQVYGFIRQSGGHVKIYSEAGQGTTVKIYLPRLLTEDSISVEKSSSVDVPLGESQEVVLVVEDEPAVRAFSVDALTELGYRVLEADGAASALRLLDAHPEIALLFTDVVMPETNGAKLAEAARLRRPDLKILFTTGYTRNAVVHNGVLDAGVELIGKPFTIEELASKVREVLDSLAKP